MTTFTPRRGNEQVAHIIALIDSALNETGSTDHDLREHETGNETPRHAAD